MSSMHHNDKEKHKSGFKGIAKEIVHFPKNITARHQIATKLPKIKVKVREISDRSKRYGFDSLMKGQVTICLVKVGSTVQNHQFFLVKMR